ncbi:glycolipid transfer protein [Panaeolus papilionaceus]|nr:glycolipid transfer protein [Panaeolus papilionaceus]
MAPYFETVKSFADVPFTLDNGRSGIDTQAFLEAADGLVLMFDLFGAGVFGFIQMDLRNNIHGVRTRYNNASHKSTTLERLAEGEKEDTQKWEAIPCLVRLMRGLALTHKALFNMQRDPQSELHTCFRQSYDAVLSKHHGFIIRNVVYVAIRSVPSRSSFYQRIAQGGSHEKLDVELAKWLAGLERIVDHMSRWLKEGGYGNV